MSKCHIVGNRISRLIFCILLVCACVLTLSVSSGTMGWTVVCDCVIARPRGYKAFSMLKSIEHETQLPIKSKMVKNKDCSCFRTLRCCMYPAHKCLNASNCWHLNNYKHINFILS